MTVVPLAIQHMIAWQAANQQHFAYSENSGRLDPETSGYTDCSGLERWLHEKFASLDIGTWTGDECTHGTLITEDKTEARNGAGMLPGDLIFYRWAPDSPATFDHVNMFVGDGMVQNHGGPGPGPVTQSLMTNVDSAATVMVRRYITQEDDMPLTDADVQKLLTSPIVDANGGKHASVLGFLQTIAKAAGADLAVDRADLAVDQKDAAQEAPKP